MHFSDFMGSALFRAPSPAVGYLSQINDWASRHGKLEWQVVMNPTAQPHLPEYVATPIFNGEMLYNCKAIGPSVRTAKEAAAHKMAVILMGV
ncbi:hypothetical protein K474DRAFT_1657058 [Panus rudis PR-1116 ss-1]|nr:hypothetical protein K474DRAFT_1657058 [Panus rudis PR-1116 ss-1]